MTSEELMNLKGSKFCLNEGRPVCLHFIILRSPVPKGFKVVSSKLELVVMPVISCLCWWVEGGRVENRSQAASEKSLVANNVCKFSNSADNSLSEVVFTGSQEEAET